MEKTSEKQELKRIANKNKIIEATVELIKEIDISDITVRKVCEKADVSIGTFYYYFKGKDELLFSFVMDDLFDYELITDESDVAGRLIELYMCMIRGYMSLGIAFMKSFYSTENMALSAYMKEDEGKFVKRSILERSEIEVQKGIDNGYIQTNADAHMICKDICTIIKGSVFEWCLCDGKMNIEAVITRIIRNYIKMYIEV